MPQVIGPLANLLLSNSWLLANPLSDMFKMK
jgi:hypothetical protein